MTNHISTKTLLDQVRSSRRTFENTRCNWCQTTANHWTSLGEENFVSIEGKTLAGEPAFAIFCPECLKDENRKNEIKFAMTIGEAEDSIPSQVQFRDLQNKGEETTGSLKGEDVEGLGRASGAVVNDEGKAVGGEVQPFTQGSGVAPGPEDPDTGVPAEEATGSGTVVARADAETGTRVAEKKEDTKKKGLFG